MVGLRAAALARRGPERGAIRRAVHDPVVKLAALDQLDEPRALDLAARGLGDGARAHEQDARWPVAARIVNAAHDLAHEAVVLLGRRALGPHLGDDVQALGPGALALDPHGGRVADAVHLVHDLLDVGRGHVLAGQDDQIFQAAGDVEEALLVHEAEVARAEPTARQQHRPGVLRVVVVAGHDTRALHPDLALLVRRQRGFGTGVARDDLHRDAGAGLAYREEPAARIESERHRARPARYGQRRLGEAIAGRDDA